MCSSPKGGSTKPRHSNVVDSTFSDMSSSEYSDMVRRANESYEHRQEELIELRKNRIKKTPVTPHMVIKFSLYERVKDFITKHFSTKQLEKI